MSDFSGLNFEELELFNRGESERAYDVFGCHPIGDGRWRFTVYAPNAAEVGLRGDFNDWKWTPMERLSNGAWTAVAYSVEQGAVYRYAVKDRAGNIREKSDPYAPHWETVPLNGSKVWDVSGYEWGDQEYLDKWRRNANPWHSPMNVYEVHLGSWRAPAEGSRFPNYHDIADQLAEYCRDMHFTHVELLPLTEFPYDPSWGYQVTGYFAPTSRYGTPQDFMYFVGTLHKAGIGVIMDWVPAHFPRDAFGLAYFDGGPVYERDDPKMAAHPDWGTLIFDYQKNCVRSFLKSSAAMFIDRYHVDGIRVDAVSSMLYLNFGRGNNYTRNAYGGDIDLGAVDLLREVNRLVKARGAISIAEESTAYAGVTAPPEDGGLGFTFKWDMGFMHDTLDYMALDPLWRNGSHSKITFSMMYAFSEHFILSYSHDEVVHGKHSMVDKMSGDYEQKFANLRALYGYQFAHSGKKHTFMGSEFAQFIEWNYEKELDWFLLKYPHHAQMQSWVRALGKFYLEHRCLWEQDDTWLGFEWLNVDDADRCSVAFMRTGRDESRVVAVCNFTPNTWDLRVGLPTGGVLTKALSSDDAHFGGTGSLDGTPIHSTAEPFLKYAHSALVPVPPLSCTYYTFTGYAELEKLEKAEKAKKAGKTGKTGKSAKSKT